jgi:hypothetical protein
MSCLINSGYLILLDGLIKIQTAIVPFHLIATHFNCKHQQPNVLLTRDYNFCLIYTSHSSRRHNYTVPKLEAGTKKAK